MILTEFPDNEMDEGSDDENLVNPVSSNIENDKHIEIDNSKKHKVLIVCSSSQWEKYILISGDGLHTIIYF